MEQIKKYDVFVSFSFKDQQTVEYVAKKLYNDYHITYWMCTEDLVGGENYKGAIVDAISNSTLVLMIQSEHSILSKEVPKEVSVALNKNKPVLPFVLDDAELSGDLEYDLIGIHRVDARKPTLDERIEELAQQIYAMINKRANEDDPWGVRFLRTRILSTPTVIPKKVFCGRDKILNEINTRFSNGERLLFLYGIGGIGKTQIVKQYVKRYGDNYDTIVFATYNGSLMDMVVAESPFTLEPELSRFVTSSGEQESDADYFKRKIEKIKKISDERTLIVIDNFDTDIDAGLEEFMDGRYHLLITTRVDFSRHYPTIEINAIESMDDLKSVFMQNYDGYEVEEDDPELEELINLVNKHTYTVELLGQHMENSGQSLTEMISSLKEKGIMSLSEEVQDANMQKHTAYENLIKMFRIFTLNEEEKEMLMYLSFMPIDGINVRSFREWANLDSCSIIKSLENKSWIVKNTEGIALHPIIREVVKHEIVANENNCAGFIERFTQAIDDKKMWQAKRTEKNRLALIAGEIITRFEINKLTEKLYYMTQALFSFGVDYKKAIVLAKRLYDYNLKTYGESAFETARAAFKCGWVYSYYNFPDDTLDESMMWLKKSDEIFEVAKMDTSDDISRHTMAKRTLSKLYLARFVRGGSEEDYNLSKKYAEASLQHAIANFTFGDYHYAKIAGSGMNLAELLLVGNEAQEAYKVNEEAIAVLLDCFKDENNVDMTLAYYLKAKILQALGDVKGAISYAEKSAELYEEYFGENHIKHYSLYFMLGDCYKEQNDIEKSQVFYNKALKVAENLFAPDSTQVAEIKEKVSL